MKTLQINDELHKQLKSVAASEGLLLIWATEEAVEDWIEKRKQAKRREQEREQHIDPHGPDADRATTLREVS